ncbi:hypothetical protein [Halostella salina]|uniref:hypothetical protein n=1 Tax=Halostella salina TaxID=1547897 RepID=UPI000EF7BA85|nr:hypothetical protein [Halostella salina]
MNERSFLVTLAVLAAVATVPAVAAAGVDGGAGVAGVADNETNDTVAPGEQLAGVVGAQGAAVDGEISERAFRVGANRSPAGPAAVVDERLPELEQRLAELEQRRAALTAAHENGTIGEGEYRARMATLAAETRNVRHMANVSADLAASGPGALSQERSERIRTLRTRAGNLTGPETAELARSIVGENPGVGLGPDRGGPPEDRGPENGSDPADDRGPETGNDAADDRGPSNGSDAGNGSADGRSGAGDDRGGEAGERRDSVRTVAADAFAAPAVTVAEP